MKTDFHCHTNCSDGMLTPSELMGLAHERGIELLAITDHDSVEVYKQLPLGVYENPEAKDKPLQLISGCEFSAVWDGGVVHIVGLGFRLEAIEVKALLARNAQAREERAERIAAVLEKMGAENALEGAKRHAGDGTIGRPHFARYLVEIGLVDSEKKAFRKYLGKGKPGAVKPLWASIPEVVSAIRAAGGVAILAHPTKYDLTRTKLLRLLDEFCDAGGNVIEVISGKQPSNETQQLVDIANERQMFCSSGSDFHQPGQPWAALGEIPVLPKNAKPVVELLAL